MRVSYLWLKDFIDFTLTPSELADLLTMAGLEVEAVEPVGPELEGILVGQVLEVRPHPNADKLTLCRVDLGDRTLEVVCGAPNVAAGQKVAFIEAGQSLPDGTVIEARPIRGIRSEGMICSGRELRLSENAAGIMVLDPAVKVGTLLRDYLGVRDWALDLEVTLNRPDCLSHLGIAREIAAALNLQLIYPESQFPEFAPPAESLTSIALLRPDLCPRYSARLIRGVKIAPSPDWMRWRLEAAGLRAINNVVDVTNYVLLEMGHPMHAFDFNRLEGRRIVVRTAAKGEKFVTLDGQERLLDDRMLLICDSARGVALAAVMGGANSEISEQTTELFLESAYFDPVNTRRTSRLLGLSTDSSRRFERGADPNATLKALDRAAQLIRLIAGGEISEGYVDVYPQPIIPRTIALRSSRVKEMLGVTVSRPEIISGLKRLECTVIPGSSNDLSVRVPTFRPDLEREIDLVEEVARLHGYDKLPTTRQAQIPLEIPHRPSDAYLNRVSDILIRLGFVQALTSSLLSEKDVSLPGYPPALKLKNPAGDDMTFLRNGLLPGLLRVAAYNLNRGQQDLRLFEIGRVFAATSEGKREWDAVAGLLIGLREPGMWDQPRDLLGFLDLKGVVESMLGKILLDKVAFFCYNIEHGTADSLEARQEDKRLGGIFQVNPLIARSFDLEAPVFAFEFDLDLMKSAAEERTTYRSFPKFPPLQRDLAFVLAADVPAGEALACMRQNFGETPVSCELFDVYRGTQIGEGMKSLAFRLNFQSPDRTLTDAEADQIIAHIVAVMRQKFDAKLRA
jgi:phenylalanyl-tRNA synthetase beta chain